MAHLIRLLLFLTFIHCCLCNCMEKVKRCDRTFQDEMKSIKYVNAESDFTAIYYDICGQDGIFNRFVQCVNQLRGQCDKSPQFRQMICHNRVLKMNSYRYTWKFNLVHDICYRTSPKLDNEFFRHERCISKILNSPRWKCDETHYKMVKQTNGQDSCPHWDEFRKCTYNEVAQLCGPNAANVSDYLFHAHSSYFTKYTTCNLEGEAFTNCWYDELLERMSPSTAASSNVMSSTQMSTSEWVEESSRSKSSPAPKQQHSTFVSVQSSEHSTEESTEWNNKMVTTDTSESYNDKKEKENPVDNDDSSAYVVEDNSISHRHEEKKHTEEKDDPSEPDEKDEDKETEHGNKVTIEMEKHEKERKIMRKEGALTDHQHSTLASVGKELYQNDSDLKPGHNAKPENKPSSKPSPTARDGKSEPVADASQKQQYNLASASVVPQAERGQNGTGNVALSPLLATLLSLLLLVMISI